MREADRLRLAFLFICLRYKEHRHPAFCGNVQMAVFL